MSRAEVVLLHPAGGYWELFRDAPNMPLNLLCAASQIYERYNVRIIDQRHGLGWRDDLKRAIGKDTICVGITTYTGPSIVGALSMCRMVRELTKAPIVWGGIHVSLMPWQSLDHPCVDMIVVGEGELAFSNLVDALATDRDTNGIPGVLTTKNIAIAHGQQLFLKMDELPPLPYELINVEKYLPSFRGSKTMNFQTSRGCPMRCGFCYNTVFNKSAWRAMSAPVVISRIKKTVLDHGINDILFVDDNFFVSFARANEIMAELASLGITWQSQGVDIDTLRRMPDDMLRLMMDSGCRRIAVGVESGSPRIRNMINKPGDKKMIVEQISRLREFNIIVHCTFMVGFPGETREEIMQTQDTVFSLMRANHNIRTPFIYQYVPFPGTKIYDLCVTQGFRPPTSLEAWNDFNVDDFRPSLYNFPLGSNITESFIKNLSFLMHFLDDKVDDYHAPFFVKFLYKLYKPLARLRLQASWPHILFERVMFQWIINILAKIKWKIT